jgi:hypothetical protein
VDIQRSLSFLIELHFVYANVRPQKKAKCVPQQKDGYRDMRAPGFAFAFRVALLVQQCAEHDKKGSRNESQQSNLQTPKWKRLRFAVFSFITLASEVNTYEF